MNLPEPHETHPPFFLPPLHHLTEDSQCECILPPDCFHSLLQAVLQHSAPQRSWRGAEERSQQQRRRGGGRGRTQEIPSDRRDYTLQHPLASKCLWGVGDSLGLLHSLPRFCVAAVGQKEKVSSSGMPPEKDVLLFVEGNFKKSGLCQLKRNS